MSFLQNLFSRRTQPLGDGSGNRVPIPPGRHTTTVEAPVVSQSASAPAQPADAGNPPENCVSFPLKAITDLFTPELVAALRKHPSEHVHIHIPRDIILPKLSAGAVRITYSQLCTVTPEVFLHADGAPTDAKILLPLDIILRQLTPPRRDDQRQPAIPVNVPSIFLKSGQAGANTSSSAKAKEPWYSQRRPTYETQPDVYPPKAPSGNGTKPVQLPASTPIPPHRKPVAGEQTIPPVAVRADCFSLPLSAVLATLPAEIRHALNGADARAAAFIIPNTGFESHMRTGRLRFKWRELRDWCSVNLDAAVAPETEIELPLATVVPLFMAARDAAPSRKQVEVDTRIPDVFSKSRFSSRVRASPAVANPISTADTPALAPPSPSPAAPPRPVSRPTVIAPSQIVEHLRKLDGVTGAFIATSDGLLVAGDVPDANENVLAAFAPTVFAQLTKYSDMARLGLPESIDIHLGGGITVHVRKAGTLYLGVLLPRDRPLPIQELTRLSRALQPNAT